MKTKKILAVILAAVMCLVMFASCTKKSTDPEESTEAASEKTSEVQAQGSDYEKIKAKGKLVVGITDFAPIDYKDENNEWTGFDAEFARAVAKELGLEVEFIEIDWGQKFSELKSGKIDCVWNGMTITDEVTLNSSVSMPYVKNQQVVVLAKDKLEQYKDVESLKELSIAVEAGSAGESVAQGAGLNTVAVENQTDTLLEVKSGASDAAIIDKTMAEAMTGDGTSYADLGIALILNDEHYGVSFRQGSDMVEKVNTIMQSLAADGTLTALSEKYKLTLDDEILKYVK